MTCGQNPSMRQRQKIIPLAAGKVLEIGIGSGLNIPLYDPTKVEYLWGLEPSAEMWAIAQNNAMEHHIEAEFIQSGAESIPLDNDLLDCVVMTYTLCTIPDTKSALAEIKRVLKPAGKLIFCEHGKAPDKHIERWQNRLNPIWSPMAGGCNLNRNIPQLLEQSGFTVSEINTMYLPGWKPASYNYWGIASF